MKHDSNAVFALRRLWPLAIALVLCAWSGCAYFETIEDDSARVTRLTIDAPDSLFATPESFLHTPDGTNYFVSNVNGRPDAADGNGYIIRLDSNLRADDSIFVDGTNRDVMLNAPKGMAIVDSLLYVTDITVIRAFSLLTGDSVRTIEVASFEPEFLNDLAEDPEGNLYVSDSRRGYVLKIDTTGNISKLADIPGANGLVYSDQGYLYCATWEPPVVVKVTLDGSVEDVVSHREFAALDGIDILPDGDLIFADFYGGAVYTYSPDKKRLAVLVTDLADPADLSFDSKRSYILIPHFTGGVSVYELK